MNAIIYQIYTATIAATLTCKKAALIRKLNFIKLVHLKITPPIKPFPAPAIPLQYIKVGEPPPKW